MRLHREACPTASRLRNSLDLYAPAQPAGAACLGGGNGKGTWAGTDVPCTSMYPDNPGPPAPSALPSSQTSPDQGVPGPGCLRTPDGRGPLCSGQQAGSTPGSLRTRVHSSVSFLLPEHSPLPLGSWQPLPQCTDPSQRLGGTHCFPVTPAHCTPKMHPGFSISHDPLLETEVYCLCSILF